MNLREIYWGVDWIHLAQERERGGEREGEGEKETSGVAVVNMIMNF
jgi:hypothetical protein